MQLDLNADNASPSRSGGVVVFSGVAYGENAVWIVDAADARNTVTHCDTGTEKATGTTKISTGITGDDVAVAPGAVLVWEPDDGHLTRVDSATVEAAASQTPHGYRTSQAVKWISSDLAVANGSAWMTDPAAGVVHRLDF